MTTRRTLALLLAASLAVSGLAAVPRAAAAPASAGARSVAAAPTATPTATHVMLTAVPTTTNRGGVVTVAGAGFASGEAINLTVSGVTGTAATAKADANGLLPATGISIPYSLKPGTYTITASGATSKRSGTVKVTVAELTPTITLSAPSASPGTMETVTGKGFGPKEQVTLSLNSEALPTSPAAITTTNGGFSATFKVPNSILRGQNTVSAIGNESRVSAVITFTGLLAQTPQFFFAGGMNDASAQSSVAILNTNGQPTSVQLTFYLGNGSTVTHAEDVAAHSQHVIPVAGLGLPMGTFGLRVQADRPIAAQLDVNRPGIDGDAMLGNVGTETLWYLAAGSTRGTFHEQVSILNPDPAMAAHVVLRLLGGPGRSLFVSVPPHTNKTVDVNRALPGYDVSVIATSDRGVVVARTVTFGPGGRGLIMREGSNKGATTWLFSDATTENGVQTIFTILNPNATAALATASFTRGGGVVLGSRTVFVPAHGHATVNTGDVVRGGGLAAQVTSNQPVVVERAEYIGRPDVATAGSIVFGRNGAGVRWSFPAGDTAKKDEVLDMFNPSAVTVPVTATVYGDNGVRVTKVYSLPPTARVIAPINTFGVPEQHGEVLESGNGQGFIAEQGISALDSRLLRHTQGLAQ